MKKSLSIFDSFVSIDNLFGAVSLVYVQNNYYIFAELVRLNFLTQEKEINLSFHNDSHIDISSFRHCNFLSNRNSQIQFGIFENENAKQSIRQWSKTFMSISTTWRIGSNELKKWSDDLLKRSNLLGSCSLRNFDASFPKFKFLNVNNNSKSYQWAEYKLSQLGINCYTLHR